MRKELLILTPKDEINKILIDFFSDDFAVIPIYRQDILKKEQLVINNHDVLLDGNSILKNTAAAFIFDSGYMWPNPGMKFSPDEWEAGRDKFDELLRNERESNSFWYSMLSILNQEIPFCINPQSAFAKEAFKPEVFHELLQEKIALPPFCIGNNKEINKKFIEDNRGEILTIPLSPLQEEGWLAGNEMGGSPLFLQSFSNKESVKVISFKGQTVTGDQKDLISTDQLRKIHDIIQAPLLELVFRDNKGWCLSDFSVCPDLTLLSEDELYYMLNEIKTTLN